MLKAKIVSKGRQLPNVPIANTKVTRVASLGLNQYRCR